MSDSLVHDLGNELSVFALHDLSFCACINSDTLRDLLLAFVAFWHISTC